MKQMILITISAVFTLLMTNCRSEHIEHAPVNIFKEYYNKIKVYVNTGQAEYVDLLADISVIDKPNNEILIPTQHSGRYLYCAHIGWQVIVALVDTNYNIIDFRHFKGKSGFSITWFQGIKLIIHRHPGTGMSFNQLYGMEINENELIIEPTIIVSGLRNKLELN